MLAKHNAIATIAVRDISRAKTFYGDTLGLKQSGAQGQELISYQCENSTLLVYRSEYAGSNRASAATWNVGDELAQIVAALQAKGATFEHEDMPA